MPLWPKIDKKEFTYLLNQGERERERERERAFNER